ncbi:MAG: DUF2809 domain-containing protein [Bacteroidota bacterium]
MSLQIKIIIIYFVIQSTFIMIFNKRYFIATVLLFLTEVFIGWCVHDTIIRPYGGDFLVVILIYCFVKSFFNTPVIATTFYTLVFAYLVEISQYFHLVNLLGWEHNTTARIVMGVGFSFIDLLAYTLGVALILLLEKLLSKSL